MRISDWSSDVCSSDLDRCQIVDVWLQLALPAADIDEAGAEPLAVVATADADPLVLQIFGADHEMTRSAREARLERAVETIAEAVATRQNASLCAQLKPVAIVVQVDFHAARDGAQPPNSRHAHP